MTRDNWIDVWLLVFAAWIALGVIPDQCSTYAERDELRVIVQPFSR